MVLIKICLFECPSAVQKHLEIDGRKINEKWCF